MTTKTNAQLDDEANKAIDECVSKLRDAWEYAPTVTKRDSALCRLLRGVYFEGRRQGLADAQAIYNGVDQ